MYRAGRVASIPLDSEQELGVDEHPLQRRLDPAKSGHADIEQGDVWVVPNAEFDCVGAIDCLKDLSPDLIFRAD